MSLFDGGFVQLTIPNSGTDSNVISAKEVYGDAARVLLKANGTLASGTYTVEVTADPDASSVDWSTLTDDSDTNIAPPAQDKSKAINDVLGAAGFRIHASSGVSGAKVWDIMFQRAYG